MCSLINHVITLFHTFGFRNFSVLASQLLWRGSWCVVVPAQSRFSLPSAYISHFLSKLMLPFALRKRFGLGFRHIRFSIWLMQNNSYAFIGKHFDSNIFPFRLFLLQTFSIRLTSFSNQISQFFLIFCCSTETFDAQTQSFVEVQR